MMFMPAEEELCGLCEDAVEAALSEEGLALLGWSRFLPTTRTSVGRPAVSPRCVSMLRRWRRLQGDALERRLYVARVSAKGLR
jgi:glutamate synthase domain-containing protein 1